MEDAFEITRQAKSNLAFALRVLPKDRRDDAVIFYAFCRVIDDLADDLSRSVEAREQDLLEWRTGLTGEFGEPDTLRGEVLEMIARRDIPIELLVAIIDGCRMDLRPQRFGTWDDLSGYIWKVACAVGLVAMRIFGAEEKPTEDYAVALGRGLQLTNILRDVGEDLSNGGRIYLPLADLHRFQYTERDLVGKVRDGRFLALMEFQAERAEGFFREAMLTLPEGDRKAMLAGEVMREIYHRLLAKIRAGGFSVFDRRYQVSRARKLAILSKHLMLSRGFR